MKGKLGRTETQGERATGSGYFSLPSFTFHPSLLTCGVDEAGRGPLAGPVYAAAVILDPARPIDGLADSKQLTAARREVLMLEIKQHALAWSVAAASVEEIDRLNILQATFLAMSRAVGSLKIQPEHVLVDGNRAPQVGLLVTAIVKGDSLVPAISAASILAKTARDAEMCDLDKRFPHYGFAEHKGYATPDHLEALKARGICKAHRRSFAPVKALLDGPHQLVLPELAQ